MRPEVILKIYITAEDAEIAQQFLASQGIPSSIRVDETGGLQTTSHSMPGVMLLIDPAHLEKAQDLLQLVR